MVGLIATIVRCGGIDNPSWFEEHPIHSPRMIVWGTISCDRVIGPFFFEGTVTGDSYLDLLKTQFWPEIVNDKFANRVVFMQDGASPNYTNKVREWLESNLNERWINRGSRNLTWSSRSPDLIPMNYFFWSFVKSLVYSVKTPTLDE